MKRKKKRDPNSLPVLLKEAERVFNAWIRNRDRDLGCISCGKPITEAGHYFPVKGHSALRFHEHNVNGQESYCNKHLHGNQAYYRIGLVAKIGEEKVLELEALAAKREVKKWSRSELLEIIEQYKL